MFGVAVGIVAVVAFIAIATKEALASTASKVQNGDSVFVPVSGLLTDNPAEQAVLAQFARGLLSDTTKVTNVSVDAAKQFGKGSIIGLSPLVHFALSQVQKIERNGTQFT